MRLLFNHELQRLAIRNFNHDIKSLCSDRVLLSAPCACMKTLDQGAIPDKLLKIFYDKKNSLTYCKNICLLGLGLCDLNRFFAG